MKKLILLSFVALCMATACQKRNATGGTTPATGTTYKGVVRINMCGQVAIETLAPNYLGEATWTGGTSGPTYHHIFSVQNHCQFGSHAEGDTVTFKVISSEVQSCAVCLAYTPTPATQYAVYVIN